MLFAFIPYTTDSSLIANITSINIGAKVLHFENKQLKKPKSVFTHISLKKTTLNLLSFNLEVLLVFFFGCQYWTSTNNVDYRLDIMPKP